MEYVRIALLIVQLLKAMQEKEKGEGISPEDIATVAIAAENMGLIKSSEIKDAKEDISIIQQLLEGVGDLLGIGEDKPKAPAIKPFDPVK